MSASDFRIDLSAPLVTFPPSAVRYPTAGGQARFDHMSSFLNGLLASQAAPLPPTIYNEGTLWFDTSTSVIRVYTNGGWVSLASLISVQEPTAEDANAPLITLQSWFSSISSYLSTFSPPITFTGQATVVTNTINIPQSIAPISGSYRVFLYINGLLKDPRFCVLQGGNVATNITLSGFSLNPGDSFTVLLLGILQQNFFLPTVTP